MGACYSKNNTGARTSAEGKGPKLKFRQSEHNKKWNAEKLSTEKVPLKDSERDFERKIDSPQVSKTSTADHVADHVNVKQVDHSIAPSDSGIESIGTAQDEVQSYTRSKQERGELQKYLEHQNFKVCQNCGHLKLNDFNLLSNSDILCDQNLTGKSIVKPKWQSHSLQSKESALMVEKSKYNTDFRVLANSNKDAFVNASNDVKDQAHKHTDSSELRSSFDKLNSVHKDMHSLSLTVNSCNNTHRSTSENKSRNKISQVFFAEKNEAKAPLAEYDSLDTNLNDDRVSNQQSLLSDFQDITESLCRCDSRSSHDNNHQYSANSSERNQIVPFTESSSGGQLVDEDERSNHLIITEQESSPHHNQSPSCNHSKTPEKLISQKLSFHSREKSCLPKNISLTHHKAAKSEAVTNATNRTKLIPMSREICFNNIESRVSESLSGVHSQRPVSRLHFTNGRKEANRCSASFDDVDVMINDSTDILVSGTEKDMTNLDDLDSTSRLPSQSTSSIRQFMGSAEEVASSLHIAVPTTIDGMDCVIIPKETYQQMQTDLSVLKQQLICLSSIIQESEGLEQNADFEADA